MIYDIEDHISAKARCIAIWIAPLTALIIPIGEGGLIVCVGK